MPCTHDLSWAELEQLVTWFAHRMGQEQRGELMAALPVTYARLYPSVAPEVLSARVQAAVTELREVQRLAVTTELGLAQSTGEGT